MVLEGSITSIKPQGSVSVEVVHIQLSLGSVDEEAFSTTVFPQFLGNSYNYGFRDLEMDLQLKAYCQC